VAELSQVMRFFPGTAEAFALVKRKLKRREPINIAAVGGSITAGAMLAGAPTYMQLWRDALQARFPTADGRNHTYVDLGYHAHDSQTLRDCFQRYWATRSPGLRPSEVDVWVLETAVTDVVLVDGSSPQQTRPWVHVEALARFLRWHSPRSAALMIWFAHGTDDGWYVPSFPSVETRSRLNGHALGHRVRDSEEKKQRAVPQGVSLPVRGELSLTRCERIGMPGGTHSSTSKAWLSTIPYPPFRSWTGSGGRAACASQRSAHGCWQTTSHTRQRQGTDWRLRF
jgi:hypothetical protein